MMNIIKPKLISIHTKLDGTGRAEVYECDSIYYIDFYDGDKRFREAYGNHSLHMYEDAAENWALGIKKTPWECPLIIEEIIEK